MRTSEKTLGWLLIAICGIAGASSFSPKPLSGTFAVFGSSPIDPDPNEPQDTHMYFFLEGEAAKELFLAMKEEPEYDSCVDDGSVSKLSRDIVCTESPQKQYVCSFSVDIVKHQLSYGKVC